jgi:predicted transcriptional regulator
MTVMERLWRKGLLRREPRGRAFQYLPAVSEAEFIAGLMHGLLGSSRNRSEVLAHFLKGMRKADEAKLLRLADEATRRRRRG